MSACRSVAAAESAPVYPHSDGTLRHCALSGAIIGQPDSQQMLAAAAQCTQRSRNLSSFQASACQPLGAWHCASGFRQCLPQIEGEQACIEHFNRYLEGHGLAPGTPPRTHSDKATDHRFVARFSTCLQRKPQPTQPPEAAESHIAHADTPSFVGNQSNGWDAMFAAIIRSLKPADLPIASGEMINLVLGFEHFPENYRIMEAMLSGFGIPIRVLSDGSAWLAPTEAAAASPTTLEELRAAPGALDTLLVRPWQLEKSAQLLRDRWGHSVKSLPIPMGLAWTDTWLNYLSQLSGEEVPAILQLQRYQLCEAIHHALPLICRQRFAVYGEPDFVMGISRYLVELGAGPAVILSQNANRHWLKSMQHQLTEWGYSKEVAIHIGTTTPSLAELVKHHQPDLLIAPPALREQDRQPPQLPMSLRRVQLETPSGPQVQPATLGYAGARHLLNAIVDAVVRHP